MFLIEVWWGGGGLSGVKALRMPTCVLYTKTKVVEGKRDAGKRQGAFFWSFFTGSLFQLSSSLFFTVGLRTIGAIMCRGLLLGGGGGVLTLWVWVLTVGFTAPKNGNL